MAKASIRQVITAGILAAGILGLGVTAMQPTAAHATLSWRKICFMGYYSYYEYRLAGPNDKICVTHATAVRTQQENRDASLHRSPNGGAYGPNTCRSGYVWRDAFNGDGVCVVPAVRDQAHYDNAHDHLHGEWIEDPG